jgi:hypothetical protein
MKPKPTKEAIEEAKNHPSGWVYEIVGQYDKDGDIPARAIKGAWKVNEKGIIEGEYIPNPDFNVSK